MAETYGNLPLSFEANQGQTDSRVKFLSRANGYSLFLTGTEAVIQMRNAELGMRNQDRFRIPHWKHSAFGTPHSTSSPAPDTRNPAPAICMKLAGANPSPKVTGLNELPGKTNYFIGNDPKKWRTNIPSYSRVKYENVYPGIDVVYYGNQRQLEHDFIVAPGVDPKAITIEFGVMLIRKRFCWAELLTANGFAASTRFAWCLDCTGGEEWATT